jgi:hypothetical protein
VTNEKQEVATQHMEEVEPDRMLVFCYSFWRCRVFRNYAIFFVHLLF